MASELTVRAFLVCPRCKDALGDRGSSLACLRCGMSIPIFDEALPVYGCFVDEGQGVESGRDPRQTWDRETFDRGYRKIGYHENGAEFDRQLGYPSPVSEFLFQRVKLRLSTWLAPAEDHRILDVGCGAGYFLLLLRQRYLDQGLVPQVFGADISLAQLSYMVRRMKKEGLDDAVAVHASGEFLPFPDAYFDVVSCSEVIEHIRNPYRALSEMYRILKPSGVLLLSTPSMTAQRTWGTLLGPLAAIVKVAIRHRSSGTGAEGGYDIPWHAREFRRAIEEAGFRIERFEHNAIIPHPWHFRFVPAWMVRPLVAAFAWVDRYLKTPLKALALHFVVRATKRAETRSGAH